MNTATFLLALALGLLAAGCASLRSTIIPWDSAPPDTPYFEARSVASGVRHHPPPDSDAVLNQLRKDGILTPKTRVVSIRWEKNARKWHVILHHAKGLQTYWETDETAKEYSGGGEKPRWRLEGRDQ